jgi:chemotaxis protein CheY-P-specific phosphatase CheC
MTVFSSHQQEQLQDLLNKGMKNASIAFSQLTGLHVEATNVKISLADSNDNIFPCNKNSDGLIVLVTRLIGDVGGKSYLVFDSNDVSTLQRKDPFSKFVNNKLLNEALLKEIDNILSAAVITVMSNGLAVNIFGDVPELENYSSVQANKIMSEYRPNGEISVIGQSSFNWREEPTFAPQFIWKFSSHILNKVEEQGAKNK